MAIIKLPEGVEIDIHVYVTGLVDGEVVDTVLSVKGLPAFSDEVNKTAEIDSIIEMYKLNELGTGWRVMTREEINNFKKGED